MIYKSLIPVMTTTAGVDGFVTTATTASTNAWKAFDGLYDNSGNPHDYYRTNTSGILGDNLTITFPKTYKIGRYTIALGYYHFQYVNLSSWEFQGNINGVWTTLHTGSKLQTTAEVLTFDITPVEVDGVRIVGTGKFGTNSWGIDELEIFEIIYSENVLVYSNGEYKKYNSTLSSWQTIISSTPTESDYLQGNTLSEIESIPESAWQQLTGTVELCYYTDNTSLTEAQFNIETEPFTLADEFEGKEVKVLEYTDNPSQVESKVETEVEPYTIYDEFGDTMEVLYYTDDASKTSADLEITANYSPLDEIDEDFEVVTWTNELTEAREEQTSVLNESIVVDDGKVYETKINLQDVIGVK